MYLFVLCSFFSAIFLSGLDVCIVVITFQPFLLCDFTSWGSYNSFMLEGIPHVGYTFLIWILPIFGFDLEVKIENS